MFDKRVAIAGIFIGALRRIFFFFVRLHPINLVISHFYQIFSKFGLLEAFENFDGLQRIATRLVFGTSSINLEGVSHAVQSSMQEIDLLGDQFDIMDLWEIDLDLRIKIRHRVW